MSTNTQDTTTPLYNLLKASKVENTTVVDMNILIPGLQKVIDAEVNKVLDKLEAVNMRAAYFVGYSDEKFEALRIELKLAIEKERRV